MNFVEKPKRSALLGEFWLNRRVAQITLTLPQSTNEWTPDLNDAAA